MKPRPGWQTWREKQRPPKLTSLETLRALVAGLAYAAAIGVALVLGIALPVALLLAADTYASTILTPPVLGVAGVALIALAGWGLYGTATGSGPSSTRRTRVVAAIVLLALALMGAGLVVMAIAPRSTVIF